MAEDIEYISGTTPVPEGEQTEQTTPVLSDTATLEIPLYEAMAARIKALVPEVRWIEMDYGQLQYEQPPVDFPAVLIDLDYQITYINDALLEYTGRHMGNMLGRDFFREVVRNDDLSKRAFKDAKNEADGNSFSITLEIRTRKGVYEDKEWQVVICKDDNGAPASYAMIAA